MSIVKWLLSLMKPLINRFPRMAIIYRSVRDELDAMEEPNITPWGFKLAGNSTMERGTFEPTETNIVRKILKDIDVFVNVGANIGYYCCHALSMQKSVIAFEPIRRNISYLCKNIKSNGWTNIEVYPIALSNNVDILEIYGGDTGASVVKGWAGIHENYVTLVPSSTMDIVLGTRLSGKRVFILIDVEGAEKWVLEGATIILANEPKPIWLVEITTKDYQPCGIKINPNLSSTFKIFFENGYKAFNLEQNMRQITMNDVELVLRGELEFSTHNFLFCESMGE